MFPEKLVHTCGETAKLCLDVIARSEATKQSTLSLPPDGLLRFARNDGLGTRRDEIAELCLKDGAFEVL
jgi:hypothetical protein